jgi:hypothetical protein
MDVEGDGKKARSEVEGSGRGGRLLLLSFHGAGASMAAFLCQRSMASMKYTTSVFVVSGITNKVLILCISLY